MTTFGGLGDLLAASLRSKTPAELCGRAASLGPSLKLVFATLSAVSQNSIGSSELLFAEGTNRKSAPTRRSWWSQPSRELFGGSEVVDGCDGQKLCEIQLVFLVKKISLRKPQGLVYFWIHSQLGHESLGDELSIGRSRPHHPHPHPHSDPTEFLKVFADSDPGPLCGQPAHGNFLEGLLTTNELHQVGLIFVGSV